MLTLHIFSYIIKQNPNICPTEMIPPVKNPHNTSYKFMDYLILLTILLSKNTKKIHDIKHLRLKLKNLYKNQKVIHFSQFS
jgi:hypothetical protein